MAGSGFNPGKSQQPTTFFWQSGASSSSSSSMPAAIAEKKSDDMEDELVACLNQVSISDRVRSALTEMNSNFDAVCEQLNSFQIGEYQNNTLKEADLVTKRVEKDLSHIAHRHGQVKNEAEDNHRLMIVYVVQAYIRCLELDTERWKCDLKQSGKSDSEISAIKIYIHEFTPWEKRCIFAPIYEEKKLEIQKNDSMADKIAFVQSALNYWRSCYSHIGEYEKIMGVEQYTVEQELWRLEQVALSHRVAACGGGWTRDMNFCRMPEPRNIHSKTGLPLSVADMKQSIQQHQEKFGTLSR